jgi:hypothetical protein
MRQSKKWLVHQAHDDTPQEDLQTTLGRKMGAFAAVEFWIFGCLSGRLGRSQGRCRRLVLARKIEKVVATPQGLAPDMEPAFAVPAMMGMASFRA